MYCSLDKIDLVVDGQPVAMQTDHRTRAEIDADPELSALFAMARVINARAHIAGSGFAGPRSGAEGPRGVSIDGGTVHYVAAHGVPSIVREALAATGGVLDAGGRRTAMGPQSEDAAG